MAQPTCSIDDDCTIGGPLIHGWCTKHYTRWWRYGDPHVNHRTPKGCRVDGCDGKHFSRHLCQKHYARWRRTGDPVDRRPTDEERFWANIDVGHPLGCWVWVGYYYKPGGYGRCWFNSRRQLAHRVCYELLVGPIPAGLHIDHLCRNEGCVNPDHLEPVTPGENQRRGVRWPSKR